MSSPPGSELRQRTPFFALLVSYGMVYFSLLLAMIAVPWFVLETTGSASKTGVVAAVQGVPMIFAGIFGGVIVERIGYRRTAMISDLMAGFSFGMIPLLHFTIGITYWQLIVFVFLRAVFDTPGFAARHSLMPDIAERAGVRLERANSISQTLMQSSILLAPALAGILIGVIGASAVLWISTALFLVSVTSVGLFVPVVKASSQAAVQAQSRYLGQLRGGLQFLFSSKLILALLMLAMMVQFIRANQMVILPVYAHDFFGSASEFGFMFAALGAGGLTSAIAFGIWGHRWPRRPILFIGATSLALMFGMLATTPPYYLILTGMVLVGLMNGPMVPMLFTLIQQNTPADMRGRVFGFYDASIFAAMVPGRLLAGYLIEWTSLVQTLLLIAGVYLVGVLAISMNRTLRNLPMPEEQAQQPADQQPDLAGSGTAPAPQQASR